MTKKSIYFGTLLLTALAFSSCASDDTATDKTAGKDTPKTGTVFSSEDEPSTRTSATYTGSGLDFYWTANDKIWVKDDNNTYHQSSEDDIASRIAAVPGSTTTAKAKFWVNGTYSNGTYKVRYTGKNGVQDKVTIKASQTQNTPNDAAHIADDGDFGVADATGSGKYSFTLNHKAAYVTFMPYTAQGVIAGAKLQKIRIYTNNTSDQLAGKFDLADNGTLSNGTTTSNSVELNVNNFSIPNVSTYATNGATMVVKPGTYNNLTIEYTLHDAVTNVTGVITKTYPSVTFDAGKNMPVRADLKVKIYPADQYYMWDAQQHYWAGHEWDSANPWQPTKNNDYNANYPQAGDPLNRYYNNTLAGYTDLTGVAPAVEPTTAHFKDLINANTALWYVNEGDPHLDNKTLWATMGHLYTGGMWLMKLDKIGNAQTPTKTVTELKGAAPNGVDYTRSVISVGSLSISTNTNIKPGIPSNSSDYFYLPFLGCYYGGQQGAVGAVGLYWTSTPHTTTDGTILRVANNQVLASTGPRYNGYRLLKASNEDEYRPF